MFCIRIILAYRIYMEHILEYSKDINEIIHIFLLNPFIVFNNRKKKKWVEAAKSTSFRLYYGLDLKKNYFNVLNLVTNIYVYSNQKNNRKYQNVLTVIILLVEFDSIRVNMQLPAHEPEVVRKAVNHFLLVRIFISLASVHVNFNLVVSLWLCH